MVTGRSINSIFWGSNVRTWPIAGAEIIEINVTLLTSKGRSERPVWLRHFDKLADSNVSFAVPR